ncbi:nucleoside triphosphate pyrophosphohydrolase family protein [Limnobacter sp.]|uniref:nucleoside triphosphate pyrophosphohydrolase family protein n=1 Tax=Limnobacter sp. TaxID=2003368 RepID=UPI0025BD9C6C|nr:nucleoside triphosphate pyrophosphohydrolase family protein [Limnobacter sp.]
MQLSAYQIAAKRTAIYPEEAKVTYPALGLAGEVGEVCNKIKKVTRDGLSIDDIRSDLFKELGDVLWYLSALAHDLDISLDNLAEQNLEKLQTRQQRGTLQGSGDNR